MLYVFQVDTGTMLTFDMRLALESVSNLREAIWQSCRIPVDRQVLLVSGGECLDPSSGVCFYAAGTDTNPIFLFNKSNIESPSNSGGGISSGGSHPIQLFPEPNNIPDVDTIKDQIEGCLNLPPTYTTVVSRAQLAQQLLETAREITKRCEQLIHDQHLQHQGWAAVVANLEDIVTSLRLRFESFEHLHSQYIECKDETKQLLERFNDSLVALDNIQIPSTLQPTSPTLLEWIKSTDAANQIQTLTTTTSSLLQNLTNPTLLIQITKETQQTIEKSNQTSMKEIKGLEERLFGLDQLLSEAKSLVQEQNELAQAFQQNQSRASDLKDTSILPDLCQSHQHQLIVMSRNHGQLEDIRRRCLKAKEELGLNLNSRLKWIVYVQKLIGDVANRIHVYSESLRRLKCYLEIIRQINGAGELYCETVNEVLRRGEFVRFYEEHTSRIVEEMEQIHKAEVEHRKEFAMKFDNHFLSSLFLGLDDYPPSFATQRPRPFDTTLPEINQGELVKLKQLYPNLATAPLVLRNQHSRIAISVQTDESKCNEQAIEELKTALEAMTKLNIDIESDRSAKIESLNERITYLETELQRTQTESENQVEEEKKSRMGEISCLEKSYEEKIGNLVAEKEEEIKCLRDNFKNEFDAVRSRYRLMQSANLDVKKSGSCEERLDSLTGGSSPIMETAPEPTELLRLIDNYIHKSQPSPGMLRRILQRYDPALARQRNSSSGSSAATSGFMDDGDSCINRSIYNIDTNAFEPSTSAPSCIEDNSYREMIELIASNESVQNRVAKLLESDRISVQSCKSGDNVLVYWNEKLSTYIIYLNTKNIHFLHTECLKTLSEMEGGQHNTILEFIGSVIEKEFCVARRPQNRYRVPQGFHFYRVRVNIVEILGS